MAARRIAPPCAPISRLSFPRSHPSSHIQPRHLKTTLTIQRPPQRSFASPRKAPSNTEIFSLSEIPPSSFEAVISRNGNSFQPLKPEEYYDVAQKFSEAIHRGSSPWTASLTGKDAIPAETLHQVACIMRQITGPRSADAFATALWSTASEMGYRPSTLSLARQLIRSGAYSRIPQLRRVEARFKGLVSTGKDADALTAEGELLFEQGRLEAAATALNKALKMGEFEWRPYCELCLGRAYLRIGKVDEARGLFEKLAEEGVVEADMELGEMLRESDGDGARQRMFTAACNGRRDMFTRLSEMELERDGEKSVEERRLWALEWSKLADGRVEY